MELSVGPYGKEMGFSSIPSRPRQSKNRARMNFTEVLAVDHASSKHSVAGGSKRPKLQVLARL